MNSKSKYSVLEYCTHLGYLTPRSITVLGKLVAKAYREAALGEPETDLRDVRGKSVPVKVYEAPNEVVESVIHNYYDKVVDEKLKAVQDIEIVTITNTFKGG